MTRGQGMRRPRIVDSEAFAPLHQPESNPTEIDF